MTTQRSPSHANPEEIIVVGAGGCGLTAALAAAQQGARVLLLEKTDSPGGNTGGTTAVIAAGTRFQREKGIEDSPAQLAEEILRRNGGQGNRALTERLTRDSAAVLEWLADTTGVEFTVSSMASGHGVSRSHSCGGGWALIRCLAPAVERHPNIRVLWSTPVKSLKLDAKGAVTGVETERGPITARKVVLAAGGFGASRELVAKHIPKAVDIPYNGHAGVTGDGLRMGMAAGGAAANLDGFLAFPAYFAPLRFPVPQPLIHLGAIMVNQQGRRFSDESKYPGGAGAKILDLPGKHAYEVFDERIYQTAREDLVRVVQAKILDKAETAAELARRLGIDPAGLEQSVQEYNRAAGGKDAFGRTVVAPLSPPLYGVKIWVALYSTVGGLKVNINAQALRQDGSVIPNLYAGGDTSEGVSGPGPGGYFPGNGTMTALGLGRIAGEHAAASLKAGA
jgi:fumarate reductase flavoprotein subunit